MMVLIVMVVMLVIIMIMIMVMILLASVERMQRRVWLMRIAGVTMVTMLGMQIRMIGRERAKQFDHDLRRLHRLIGNRFHVENCNLQIVKTKLACSVMREK